MEILVWRERGPSMQEMHTMSYPSAVSVKLTSIVLCSPRRLGRQRVVSRLKVAVAPNGRDFFFVSRRQRTTLLPFNRGRGLTTNVIAHSVYPVHFVDDT